MNVGFGKELDTTASQERTDRISESAARIQEGAKGKVPESAVIEGISSDKGTKVDENIKGTNVVQQDPNTKARVKTAESVRPETVTTGGVASEGRTTGVTTDTLAIQQSVTQQKSIEATAALKDAEMAQQTALFNAQNVFQMDMAQFSADQQRAVNNAKFLQTVSLTNANMEQQAVVQDAVLLSQANLAEADQNTKLGIQHAQAFLAMDMANLNIWYERNVNAKSSYEKFKSIRPRKSI